MWELWLNSNGRNIAFNLISLILKQCIPLKWFSLDDAPRISACLHSELIWYQANGMGQFSWVSYGGRILQCLNSTLRRKGRDNLSQNIVLILYYYCINIHEDIPVSVLYCQFQCLSFLYTEPWFLPLSHHRQGIEESAYIIFLQCFKTSVQNIQKYSPIIMIFFV